MAVQLYEVLWREGEEELKKYVLATDEVDLQQYIQNLAGHAYYMLAEGDAVDTTALRGPTQLTKDPNQLGVWLETA